MSMSQRRPKSSAATLVSRRHRTLEAPPWNNSIRTGVQRSASSSTTFRRAQGHTNATLKEELYISPAQDSIFATPAAALVATKPPAGEPQVELMCQLQDVVVRLSQSAVDEKQRLAHMRQRVNAYAALVREQDCMIDELRGMNIKLQKEKDTLMAFRQQSLNHDLHLMSSLENNSGAVEDARRAQTRHDEAHALYGGQQETGDSFARMTPRSRNFVRSLVAQLRDERRKRLEVEEQSSRMIGEQQLTIQRLEDRLRTQNATPRGGFYDCVESSLDHFCLQEPNKKRNLADAQKSLLSDMSMCGPTGLFAEANEVKKSAEAPNASATAASSVVQSPIFALDAVNESLNNSNVPLSHTQRRVQQVNQKADISLTTDDVTYEDATTILSNIRKKHGL